jgi:phosphoserine phosphatase RsbU/P
MQRSVERMGGLIVNVLDLARSRLGGGIALNRRADRSLAPALEQVVEELRAGWPEREIHVDIDVPRPVDCDAPRIAQLLSNLLANALTHGSEAPVSVTASLQGEVFELSVANQGTPIPPTLAARLFEPFYRPASGSDKQGLGLGLYIASEIAEAHGGTLTVASAAEETRFTFRMPAPAALH